MTSLLFDADDDDDELSATTVSFDETPFDVSNDTVDDIFSFKMSSVTTEKDHHPLVTISRTKPIFDQSSCIENGAWLKCSSDMVRLSSTQIKAY